MSEKPSASRNNHGLKSRVDGNPFCFFAMHYSPRNVVIRRLAPSLLVALAGCGGSDSAYDAAVQGTVTVDDELAPGGTVVFSPTDGGPVAVGNIAKDGSYSLRIGRGDTGDPDNSGIPSGEYVVTVSILGPSDTDIRVAEGGPPAAGPRLVADKYADKQTSDLKFNVKEGVNVIVLKLDGPWANPPVEEASGEEATGEAASAEQSEIEGAIDPGDAESALSGPDQSPESGETPSADPQPSEPQPPTEEQPQ